MEFSHSRNQRFVIFRDAKMMRGSASKHLVTRSRPLQIMQRNLNRMRTWPHPMRKGQWEYFDMTDWPMFKPL